jgi:sulfide:quinone oxidoreductase
VTHKVVVLGAGFGGLELTSRLSEALDDEVEITLIDARDSFVFGFAKLDMMFGHASPEDIHAPYSLIDKPGVRFVQETIISIDPAARRVTTSAATYEGEVLVVALGADLDASATPGVAEAGYEFYSVQGAARARDALEAFRGGRAVVGVCGPSFKCPPAPSETALLLEEYLRERGIREDSEVTLVMPFGKPVPPSPETSDSLLARFAERGIRFVGEHLVASFDPERHALVLNDGSEVACDFLLAIPVHRVPAVVEESGLAVDGWVPVDPATLATRLEGVYAVGDVTSVGTAKAGVFAEGAAKVVADHLIASWAGGPEPAPYDGAATCYVEFGDRLVGRVDVNFLSGPSVTGRFTPPSLEVAAEKAGFKSARLSRWFGL